MAYLLALILSLGLTVSGQSTSRYTPTVTVSAPSGTVIDIAIPGGSQYSDPLVASIINVNSDLTTLALGCTPGFDTVACDFYPSVTVTVGPSTFSISQAYPEQALTIQTRCSITSERPGGAVCTVLATGNAGDSTRNRSYDGTVVNTYSASEVLLYPVTATAGATADLVPDTTVTVIPTSTPTGADTTVVIITSSRTTTTSSSSSRPRSNPTTTGGSTTTAQVATSSTPTPAAANTLAPGIIAGGLAGVVAFLL